MSDIDPDVGTRIWTALVVAETLARDDTPLNNWRTSSGQRPSDQWLASQGYLGYFETSKPEVNPFTHKVVRLPLVVDEEAATATQGYESVALTQEEADFYLESYNKAMSDAVTAERDRRMADGFYFMGVKFQTRNEDQKRISGAGTLALGAIVMGSQPGDLRWHGGTSDFVWISEDNTEVPMDAQTVFAFGRAAAQWESKHVFVAKAIKAMNPIPENFADDMFWPPEV